MSSKKITWKSIVLILNCYKTQSSLQESEEQVLKRGSFQRLCLSDISIPSSPQAIEDLSISLVGPKLYTFTLEELREATHSFSWSNLLGEGGFGPVYKGFVDDKLRPGLKAQSVAVKQLNLDGFQGHREWLAEIIFLGQLRHPHLVKLIGYCCEEEHRLLVYEYMARGSLENQLFRSHLSTKSDVYSYGVVLLELLTGRRVVDKCRPNRERSLVEWARPLLRDQKKLHHIIDPRLEGQFPTKGALKVAALTYKCLSHHPYPRPTMSDVVKILESLQDFDDVIIGPFVHYYLLLFLHNVMTDDDDDDDEEKHNNIEKYCARSVSNNGIFTLVSEEKVTNSETHNNGNEDPSVEGHNRQHQQIPDGRAQPKEKRPGDLHPQLGAVSGELPLQQRGLDLRREGLSGTDELEANSAILNELVESGNDQTCKKGKEIIGPILGLPGIDQEIDLPAPVKGHLSTKSDVYSYGVVLLELLTGRRVVDKCRPNRERSLVEWARPLLRDQKKLHHIIDPRLEGQFPTKGALKVAALTYKCLSHHPYPRPTMSDVVKILESLQDFDDVIIGPFVYVAVSESSQ
ncbi:hypothetical protein DEO72_LG11g3360 [Vigna unguiculata]|uniref:non-specific serine/threonine protein kinase n=1 Tax=Vigna unguiculata TaxID=3917 RepID=A0A4D6NRT7_VIGUN|nr:hypothetical protein DEO72_LG11g3360 [Vigna unguiculata]